MFRKNVASQFITFNLVSATDGSAVTGATVTIRRCIDGTFAAGGGTVTEDGSTGFYKYAMSQADTNGNNIGFHFSATGAVAVSKDIVTTAADPTDTVRFGLTALPNAAAEAAGGLYTRGTGAGQIAQDANGNVRVNVDTIKTNAVVNGGTITFPSNATLASTTNITAGTVTTATNVTTVNGLAANVITAASMAADASAEIADAVWDEDATGHQTQGTFGQAIGDPVADTNTIFKAVVTDASGATVGADSTAILADTNELQTDWADGGRLDLILDARASQTSVNTIDDFLDTEVAAILEDTGTTIPNQITALNNLSAAQVNAEVVDALATDTYAEPGQGAPAATASLAAKINYLYKNWRNKKTQTATTFSLFNDDAATVDQKSTVADDGATATRGEMATGP